jgi:Apoptosis-antagonizing transcription factor, C-terminal
MAHTHNGMDYEDLDMPGYLETIEPEPQEQKKLVHFIEDIWVPEPKLVEKSLAELEEQDQLYRARISQVSVAEKLKASQLNLQKQIYKENLELGAKLVQIANFSTLPDFKIKLKSLLRKMISLQNKLSGVSNGKFKEIEANCSKVWDWMAESAREWSSRVDLRIGADIIDQVLREAEKKTDYDIQAHLLRELKTESAAIVHSKTQKPKHKFSKHRKLKFDVHEKLQNFMTPEHAHWDSKHENLVKTLFGKKTESDERIYLDIPLV